MHLSDFDFDLPLDRIAQRPVEPRDAARLLRVSAAGLADRAVRDLPALLDPGDLLIFNDTEVVPARLTGRRGEVSVSVTLHQAVSDRSWRVLAKPAKRLRPGDRVTFGADFAAEVVGRLPEGDVELRFDRGGADLVAALHAHGAIPLPPYIRGGIADEQDRADYQTVFARHPGAVAAPTAALHFTPALLDALRQRAIDWTMLTLHVGAGTFLPVKSEQLQDHVMHEERGSLSAETASRINETRRRGGKIVAVGTTSLRLVESAAREDGRVAPFEGSTGLFITPGYRFKAIDRLLTNFHLPRSTLFVLVAAFAGLARMKAAYEHARDSGYRFYSYGDCCLIDRTTA